MTPNDRLLMWFCYFLLCFMIPYSANSTENEVVQKLHALKLTYHSRLTQMDQNINTTLVVLHDNIDRIKHIDEAEAKLAKVYSQKHEYITRLNFFDRLLFLTDNISTGSERQFYLDALKKMSNHNPATSISQPDYWKFSVFLHQAIADATQESDDISLFIEELLRTTSIINPKHSEDFLKLRDYTNGIDNKMANTSNSVEAGDIAEAAEKKELEKRALENKNKIFEQRKPVLKPAQTVIEQKIVLKNPLEKSTTELQAKPLSIIEKQNLSLPTELESTPQTADEGFEVKLLPKNKSKQ